MPMTVGSWNSITIGQPTNPLVWVPQMYAAPSFVVDAIVATTAVSVFCVSDAGIGGPAVIAFPGGTATIPSAAITTIGVLTTNTTVMDDGETWYSVRAGLAWYFYGRNSGVVRSLADSTALGAFIS